MILNKKGFSLIELLVVTVIMGLVVASIYTLYTGTQKTAITSEEVVDVQQNLRFALDQIASDIRLAGFLIDRDRFSPIEAAPNQTLVDADNNCLDLLLGCFTVRTSMDSRRYARVVTSTPDPPNVHFTVAFDDMTDFFQAGDPVVIVRPSPREILSGGAVFGKSRNDGRVTVTPAILGGDYFPGDVIAPASDALISYQLAPDPNGGPNVRILRRTIGTNTADVAGKISDLRFSYILENGGEFNSVVDQLRDIVAVRVRIEGQTDETMTGQDNFSGIKTRALETVVRLRNR